jgi:hypothetical protein
VLLENVLVTMVAGTLLRGGDQPQQDERGGILHRNGTVSMVRASAS